ncbi:hypothetical protein, partial [Achromobacter sp. AGC25]
EFPRPIGATVVDDVDSMDFLTYGRNNIQDVLRYLVRRNNDSDLDQKTARCSIAHIIHDTMQLTRD